MPDLNFGQIAAPENFPAPFVPFSINPALATPGFGIVWRGGHGCVDHVKIFGAASDAIHLEGGTGLLELKSVTGGQGGIVFGDLVDSPNGGFGLLVTDGAFVRVSDQDPAPNPVVSNVAGASGDIHVGDVPGLTSTWAAFHASKQLYDIPPASPLATASGSRVFEKP